jgi:hypothetical protein
VRGDAIAHIGVRLSATVGLLTISVRCQEELSIAPDLFMFLTINKQSSVKVSLLTAAPAFLAMTTSFGETTVAQIDVCGVVEARFPRMEVRWMSSLRNRASRGVTRKLFASKTVELSIKPISN